MMAGLVQLDFLQNKQCWPLKINALWFSLEYHSNINVDRSITNETTEITLKTP